MVSVPQTAWWREAADPAFALFLVTVVASLVRAADQPALDIAAAGTTVSVTPADALLVALAVVAAVRLARTRRIPAGAVPVAAAAAAFGGWLFVSSLPNGATAVVAAGKLLALGALALGAVVLVDSWPRLLALLWTLTGVSVAATVWGLVEFAGAPGSRVASFLGEHDLAALSTAALALGLVALVARRDSLGTALPLVAGVSGALGITLGAALASLLGLYLAVLALLLLAAARGSLTGRAAIVTLAVCAAITAGTLQLRSGDLGFLGAWFGTDEDTQPGQYAGSWSQRLLFSYIGGRVFLANPVAGTGWYGELPPGEYARFLPDARARFPDQPPHYFPPEDGTFIPQQTYDQVLYELGLIGAALFVALAAAVLLTALRAGRAWPRGAPDEPAAFLPLAWTASLAGALAGAALFGGTPIAALFWLTLGVVAAVPSLRERRSISEPESRRAVAVAR